MESIKPQIKRIRTKEVLLRDGGEWLYFTDPYDIFCVERLDDVLPTLHKIEQMVQMHHWYAAGFLSYEAAPAFDPALSTHNELGSLSPAQRSEFPYLWFGLYPPPRAVTLPEPDARKESLEWRPTTDCETYHAAIGKIKDHIAQGRTYQVNFTMRLQATRPHEEWQFFLQLIQRQNRHAACIDTGRYTILSASPELFFRLDGNTITCRPMKGTTSRGRTTVEDLAQSAWLQQSVKNRAENVMIVDMLRNDLGRIAEKGSVTVPQLFETERYPTLWQMTSTVTAQTNASLTEILTALFPSASITGAPKVSTMRIIAELENTPRKIYTGTIGYLAPQRKAAFNVAIRTVLADRERNQAEYGVGGGVVWDSTGSDEYAEALLKARVLVQPSRPFSLFETLLWTEPEGFFLREKHIRRMLDSADYFDIPLTKEELEGFLDEISSRFDSPQRVRVLLDPRGDLHADSSAFAQPETNQPLRVRLAGEPVDSGNVFLFHKTTQREIYESARQAAGELDDVLLYNERGELTEFTIGNLVLERDGQRFTPPIPCGVLAGTFRAHLLETGQLIEKVLPVQELRRDTKLFRVNSLRGWQAAELVG